MDEVITRLRYDVGHSIASRFIRLYREAEQNGVLKIHAVDKETWKRAEAIFSQYRDANLSFTDCCSFAFLESVALDAVFGFDAHFEMMGYLLHPKF